MNAAHRSRTNELLASKARPSESRSPWLLVFHVFLCASYALAQPAPAPAGGPPSPSTPGPAIHELQLELDAAAVRDLRRDPRRYVHAKLTADGVVFRDVGVRLKGSVGSFRPLDDRPSWTVDLERFVGSPTFGGATKFHLNNSVEDPSLLNEWIGSALFEAAGIPTPAVSHARVTFNGRKLGLYVLKEGYTPAFLARNFGRPDGALFEPYPGNDIDGRLRHAVGPEVAASGPNLSTLANAAAEPQLPERWRQLNALLEPDRFATFLAVEVILNHRDGYTLARNNYRVYVDPTSQRAQFLPHGMDQLFTQPEAPWQPHMAGLLARVWMETPEGRQRFEERVRRLAPTLLHETNTTQRIREIVARLRPALSWNEARRLDRESAALSTRIAGRATSLARQLAEPIPRLLEFTNAEARLARWSPASSAPDSLLDERVGPENRPALHIRAARTAAAWKTVVYLAPGRYRFEGRVSTHAVSPLPFGRNQGACLRVLGTKARSENLAGDQPWQRLSLEFSVLPTEARAPRELACELRAGDGEAWFEIASLRLLRLGTDPGPE